MNLTSVDQVAHDVVAREANFPVPAVAPPAAFSGDPKIAPAFTLYWDLDAKAYKMVEPLVVGPKGQNVLVSAVPNTLDYDKTYWCVVRCSKDGDYEAKIETGENPDRGVTENWPLKWVVRLFKTPRENPDSPEFKSPQVHVGAVVVGGGGGGGDCEWLDPLDDGSDDGS